MRVLRRVRRLCVPLRRICRSLADFCGVCVLRRVLILVLWRGMPCSRALLCGVRRFCVSLLGFCYLLVVLRYALLWRGMPCFLVFGHRRRWIFACRVSVTLKGAVISFCLGDSGKTVILCVRDLLLAFFPECVGGVEDVCPFPDVAAAAHAEVLSLFEVRSTIRTKECCHISSKSLCPVSIP